jgi:hypothetical protein
VLDGNCGCFGRKLKNYEYEELGSNDYIKLIGYVLGFVPSPLAQIINGDKQF